MLTLRPAGQRGHFNFGWLDTYHTFSFGEYRDPNWMRFRSLRVINEDHVAPGAGFGTHPHRDMEIITVVLSGALEHRDSLGNGSVIRPGDVQRMTAGRGIEHSEFNPDAAQPVHLLQIWLFPASKGLDPEYEQASFDPALRVGRWQLAASPDGSDASLRIHQHARLYLLMLPAGMEAARELAPGRAAWVQVASGAVEVDGQPLGAGDGAGITEQARFVLQGVEPAELLVFDLA